MIMISKNGKKYSLVDWINTAQYQYREKKGGKKIKKFKPLF